MIPDNDQIQHLLILEFQNNKILLQSFYNFEPNQVVQCIYEQPDLLIIDQQPNTDLYQQPNFFSDQHDLPGQTQLLEVKVIV